MIGTTEILIIAGVVLVIFGGAAIPRFARSLGRARKEFEAGVHDGERDADEQGAKAKVIEKKGDRKA